MLVKVYDMFSSRSFVTLQQIASPQILILPPSLKDNRHFNRVPEE